MRVFKSGVSCGQSPVNYLLDDGGSRSIKPLVLDGGDPRLTISAIDSVKRKYKYVSGAIAFRNDEKPTKEQMHQIIDMFKATFCPGLTGENFNSLFVLHRDKGNDEIHFILPMVELQTGRQMNIHPSGKRNIQLFEAYVQCANHRLGYSQIVPDKLAMCFSDFEQKTEEGKNDRRQKGLAHEFILREVRAGHIKTRDDLCRSLEDELGITVTRKGRDYISVVLPGAKKAKRLRGEVYSENADYTSLLEQSRQAQAPKYLTAQEYQQAKNRLNELVNERREFNIKAYLTPKPMRHRIPRTRINYTTIKESSMKDSATKPATISPQIKSDIPAFANTKEAALQNIRRMKSGGTGNPARNGATDQHDDFTAPNGITMSDSVRPATEAVSMAQTSLNNAIALLANAKTPQEKARAQKAVNDAKARYDKATAMLAAAKLREVNATDKSHVRRFR